MKITKENRRIIYQHTKKSIKRNYQRRLKRNYEAEKCNNWKTSLEGFNRRFEQQKESVKLMTGLIKIIQFEE